MIQIKTRNIRNIPQATLAEFKNFTLLDVIIFLYELLFVYAAVSKLMDFEVFQAQIGKSPIIEHHSMWISWVVPALELIICILLLLQKTQLVALFMSFSLMTLFTVYIIFILKFSPYVPCSCGGILNDLGWAEHVIFNAFFIALALIAIWQYNRLHPEPSKP
jgi:uncharacterized membrane protein YphA (DoxX/SURF4 family)